MRDRGGQSGQFDNDRIFAGAHARPDTFGRVVRLCLSPGWCTEVDLDRRRVRFYALRRREPSSQSLLRTHPYRPMTRRCTE